MVGAKHFYLHIRLTGRKKPPEGGLGVLLGVSGSSQRALGVLLSMSFPAIDGIGWKSPGEQSSRLVLGLPDAAVLTITRLPSSRSSYRFGGAGGGAAGGAAGR